MAKVNCNKCKNYSYCYSKTNNITEKNDKCGYFNHTINLKYDLTSNDLEVIENKIAYLENLRNTPRRKFLIRELKKILNDGKLEVELVTSSRTKFSKHFDGKFAVKMGIESSYCKQARKNRFSYNFATFLILVIEPAKQMKFENYDIGYRNFLDICQWS